MRTRVSTLAKAGSQAEMCINELKEGGRKDMQTTSFVDRTWSSPTEKHETVIPTATLPTPAASVTHPFPPPLSVIFLFFYSNARVFPSFHTNE